MDNILKEIVVIIKEETENINKKIYGTTFLEILKEKILNKKIKAIFDNFPNSNTNLEENIYVPDKNLFLKLCFYQNPKSILKSRIDKNMLLIVFKEIVKIDILNNNTNKYVNINLRPLTGITLSKDTVCNLNYPKNSIILKLVSEDLHLNIEKQKDETI